ncbi:MAG: 16S rRNA (cytidine(1402)-2'-O)-methyltransferase [Parcubacteria group bacterium CG23_combo_of_CG06-09_8_20_14_all_35_6]|nr:MAG: 16S rRNA (cytidine(1402)-2'-O)-methyltransferase [Parcubacteria group bacterium CG23_combo_of_CG06-09_8_20_14_all_35_6]PIR58272.1 MAG: 16S rRNA (cytidine(1402)-2'-O)-methyltransferase [Parcubacteria group bacterium CG10_big_fil_rev_8_21_14_0_10_35_15]
MATLYIVATPIGNLEDIARRALRILSEVDLILAEDTRVTRKLLSRYQINKPLISYHQHSKLQKVDYILDLLKAGKNLALVSDAGTPGISDPGNLLIERIVSESIDDIKIAPIPGPSALTTSVSISGFPMDKFLFLGFPPAKKKRKKFFEEVLKSKYPVILYESSHRILKTMRELKELTSFQKELSSLRIVVCHELTKMFETIYRGNLDEIITQMNEKDLRGEFVIIINSGVK